MRNAATGKFKLNKFNFKSLVDLLEKNTTPIPPVFLALAMLLKTQQLSLTANFSGAKIGETKYRSLQ
jgi:hypothetical protein